MILAQPEVASKNRMKSNSADSSSQHHRCLDEMITHSPLAVEGVAVDWQNEQHSRSASKWPEWWTWLIRISQSAARRQTFGLWSNEKGKMQNSANNVRKMWFFFHFVRLSFASLLQTFRYYVFRTYSLRTPETRHEIQIVSSAETSPVTKERKREEGRKRREKERFISKWNLHTIITFYANNNIIFHVCARLPRRRRSSQVEEVN